MNRDIKGGLLTLLLLLLLSACEKEDSLGPDGPEEGNRYLTGVIAERHIGKEEIAAMVADYAAGQDINLPESAIVNLLCDVDVAAIEYTTTGVDGSPVTASGVVAIPGGTTSYDHLLSIQHVTLDMEEAPSLQLFYYEMIPVVNRHVVVMADYLGYGSSQTADRQHPYLHARLTGSACADMIEAAREYLNYKEIEETDDDIELIGYSQGGHASVATLLELEARGQGGRIRAVHAGGGAYNLESLLETFTDTANAPSSYSRTGYAPYLIRGMAYGERLDLSDSHLYAPEVIANGLNEMFSTRPLSEWHKALGDDITRVLHPDFFAAPTYNGNADVLAIIQALRDNSLLNASVKPQAPIHLYHVPTDEQVPYVNATTALEAWPGSTLSNREMTTQAVGGGECFLRYMGLWEFIGPLIK